MQKINPDPSKVWDKSYITYRRLWLDSMLDAFSPCMSGIVIDLGGKREKKRGLFQAPEGQARAWWYINLDVSTSPNIFADVSQVPLERQSADYIICTEVLEHLPNPRACVDEIYRLLHDNGVALVSVPFLYPVHADPFDFQRFTKDGLRGVFSEFSSVEIREMGGLLGTIGMFLELGIPDFAERTFRVPFKRRLTRYLGRLLCWLDLLQYDRSKKLDRFTTGYFVMARK